MTRLQVIAFVLHWAAPHWRPVQDTALELERLERKHRIDAVLVIAMARHESQWQEHAVNHSSGTLGLLQIQPLNDPECRAATRRAPEVMSFACSRMVERALNWRENLRIGVSYYASARRYCLRRGRGGAPEAWLQLPTGFDAVRGSRCGWRKGHRLPVPEMIAQVLREAASLGHDAIPRSLLASARAGSRGPARVRIARTQTRR